MEGEKQIEEMALDLENHTCMSQFQAEIASRMLYGIGYRRIEQGEWISVNERLPESDGEYLVWNDFHGAIVGHYWARGRYFISKAVTVTHWMPLPQPPKKGE